MNVKQVTDDLPTTVRLAFLTQILAKLVVESGGELRIRKADLVPYLGPEEEGILLFDIEGDDFVVRAMRGSKGVS